MAFYAHKGSWNILGATDGANDASLVQTMTDFYNSHLTVKPWEVKTRADCPDMEKMYLCSVKLQSVIITNLKSIQAEMIASDLSSRYIDI